ncbi:Receptor-like protein kinase [Melia azedarach]|nr:Receptor-like protein kinase [Melia azedarach]
MIESLDLSHNKLSGQIPSQLTELDFLSNFNLSYNNLSGPTPNAGQFANFDETNYRGNPGLCGPTIDKNCTGVLDSPTTESGNRAEEDESAVDMVSFYWSFAASYVTLIKRLTIKDAKSEKSVTKEPSFKERERSAKLKVLCTAPDQDSAAFFLSSSFKVGRKMVAFLCFSPKKKTSSSFQTAIANPAADAAPRAVASMSAGLITGLPNKSACKNIRHKHI